MNQVNDIFITSPENGYFVSEKNNWWLKEFKIGDNCKGVLACDSKDFELTINSFDLSH